MRMQNDGGDHGDHAVHLFIVLGMGRVVANHRRHYGIYRKCDQVGTGIMMTETQITIGRIAQKLDDVMQYSKGTKMVSDAQWVDIVEMLLDECPKAYEALEERFEREFSDTLPCLYCGGDDHVVSGCLRCKVDAKLRAYEEAADRAYDEQQDRWREERRAGK